MGSSTSSSFPAIFTRSLLSALICGRKSDVSEMQNKEQNKDHSWTDASDIITDAFRWLFCFIDIKLPWRHLLQITIIYTYMKSTSTLNEQFKFSDMSVCLVVTQQVCFDVFAYIQSPMATLLIWTLTSRRKSSSRSRSRRSRMSVCRHSSELHRRFCRTVRVRFPVSWLNLNKWNWSTHTWDRPAGGVARGLGGLSHKR